MPQTACVCASQHERAHEDKSGLGLEVEKGGQQGRGSRWRRGGEGMACCRFVSCCHRLPPCAHAPALAAGGIHSRGGVLASLKRGQHVRKHQRPDR
eukprot:1434627-Rhodomonas_salina.2